MIGPQCAGVDVRTPPPSWLPPCGPPPTQGSPTQGTMANMKGGQTLKHLLTTYHATSRKDDYEIMGAKAHPFVSVDAGPGRSPRRNGLGPLEHGAARQEPIL